MVVIIVVWTILLLVIYMVFLACLEPILSKRLAGMSYRQQHNSLGGSGDSDNEENGNSQLATYGSSVMGRVGHQQSRWKVRVVEQRRNIYDRHSMLN